MKQAVLSIAGSDSSGGAGVQADLKTFTTIGVYGAAAITALTVQNTVGVFESVFLDASFVAHQIRRVIEDIPVAWVKTGMLGSTAIIEAVAESVPIGMKVVCDPVMYSKSGYSLLQSDAIEAMKNLWIARATIVTPNYHELAFLLGGDFVEGDPEGNGKRFLDAFPEVKAILVKGGHREASAGQLEDILVWREDGQEYTRVFSHPYYDTRNTHGTGCTLASAIAAYLCRGETMVDAVEKAIEYVSTLIAMATEETYGRGHGALPHYRFCSKEDV